ncbi:MAG: phosphoribosylformylglycinamidine synthase I, partial [Flavobacteriales bacterium]
MKTGVVHFPGANCDDDMVYVMNELLGQEVEKLWHKEEDLKKCDLIVLPGGFTYGDYLRPGAIAQFSPIMKKVKEFAEKGGRVLGICNGFQVLCESGLLPGALLQNENQKFICRNEFIKCEVQDSPVTKKAKEGKTYKVPIAHSEGKFYANDEIIEELKNNNRILFRYSNRKGKVETKYNPNGSVDNIAGI